MSDFSLIEQMATAAESGEHYEVHRTEVPEVLRALKITDALEDLIESMEENVRIAERNTKLFAQEERWGLAEDYIRIADIRRGVLTELKVLTRNSEGSE